MRAVADVRCMRKAALYATPVNVHRFHQHKFQILVDNKIVQRCKGNYHWDTCCSMELHMMHDSSVTQSDRD